MAEAVAVVGLIISIIELTDFSAIVVGRLKEFNKSVAELPECFQHMSNQLPILISIAQSLETRARSGDFTPVTEEDLIRVIQALKKELTGLDDLLSKILPSAKASTWEKGLKAVKSIKAQKTVDTYATVIQNYVHSLNAFQIAHQSDQIKTLTRLIEQQHIEKQGMQPESSDNCSSRDPVWMLEFEGEQDFVGREDVISQISQRFEASTKRVAVVGIGGVGKSRIAIEYCHGQRLQGETQDIFWVHGTNRAKFEAAYRKVARLLNIPGKDDKDRDVLQLVRDHLSETSEKPWLIVLDNADDHDLWLKSGGSTHLSAKPLIEYLPRSSNGRILITTRDGQLGLRLTEGRLEPIQVSRLDLKHACQLLRAKVFEGSSLSDEDATELTNALEHLPLTITQAAAYLNEIGVTAVEYLAEFRIGLADIPDLLSDSIDDPTRDRETSNSIFQTWRLSFDQISKQNHRAAEILSLMAMLDRQGVPQDLLRNDGESTLQFRAAISKLKAFSFIVEEKEVSKYSMHRLVQVSTWQWIDYLQRLKYFQETAVIVVSRCCPPTGHFEHWTTFVELSPHINAVLEYDVTSKSALVDRANILHRVGHYTMEFGQDKTAQEFFNKARSIRHEHLGPEHEDTLTTMGLYGVTYSKLGNQYWREAQNIQREVVEKAERSLGVDHRLTLKSKSRFAITLNKQAQNERCRKLQVEVLRQMEQVLGPEDPDTMTEMSNLLFTLNNLQLYTEANLLGQRALALRSRVLGSDHPDTVTIMASLCKTYNAQKRWTEAAKLEQRVLELRLQSLGPEHPKTLQAMENLARSFEYEKKYEEAEDLLTKVLEGRRKTLGCEDGSTKRAEYKLGKYRMAVGGVSPGTVTLDNLRGASRGPSYRSRASYRGGYRGANFGGFGSGGQGPDRQSSHGHQSSHDAIVGQNSRKQSSTPPLPYSERNLGGDWRRGSRGRSPG